MSKIQLPNNLYSFPSPLFPSPFAPIIAKRAPLTTDYAPLGAVWIEPSVSGAWILVSIISNVADWVPFVVSGGAGTFTSLTVTPGPISLSGTTTINTAGTATTTIGNTTAGVGLTGPIAVSGTTTVTGGNVSLVTPASFFQLPGPVNISSGAGAPAGALALHIGDMYINTTAASATTRAYMASAVGTWVNFTMSA